MNRLSSLLKNLNFLFCLLFIVSCEERQINVYQQWHTISLSFEGPETSEDASENPFLKYKLEVEFEHREGKSKILGFYAADGNAAETSAESGNIWQVRFTPDKIGEWTYKAILYDQDAGKEIKNSDGKFRVIASDKKGSDFRAHGRLIASKGYFRYEGTNNYWLKGGTDSPENMLAYKDFDGTYRMAVSNDEGEASTDENIHTFNAHIADWKEGDPVWKGGRGKGLIGGMNYLASKGMNVAYFITMNIQGDGKDVWPYRKPDDFTRFDVSKLEQWEIVFQHMQAKGIMLHIVLQETENETLLDNGDTGPLRRLYFNEMIARFGHHLALTWNLGEENGPAHWTPIAQNDEQRKDMVRFFTENDPYNHPLVLHTHSSDPHRTEILEPILGFDGLDGLSLQVDKREGAAQVVENWKERSSQAGNPWMINMDEIGMWHTGAKSDSLAPQHDSLRSHVLWGTLMSGASGIEWYFGARNKHNDLTTEDWRSRNRLWELTRHATRFFENHLPYWEMSPRHDWAEGEGAYCLVKENEIITAYLPDNSEEYKLDLSKISGEFSLRWYDPLKGGELIKEGNGIIEGGKKILLTPPTIEFDGASKRDWVVLLNKLN